MTDAKVNQSSSIPISSSFSPLIAGVTAGSTSTVLLYPLDLIKVRIQVNEDSATFFRRSSDNNVKEQQQQQPVKKSTPPPRVKAIDEMKAFKQGEGGSMSSQHCRNRRNHTATLTSSDVTRGSSKQKMNIRHPFVDTFRSIMRHEGFLGLYQGLTPALVGSAVSWGGYFYFYEIMKGKLRDRKARLNHNSNSSSNDLGPIDNFAAACGSGATMVLLTNPLWLIKTRMQLQLRLKGQETAVASAGVKPQYSGLVDAVKTIIREEGPLALYKGAIPALMLTSHGGIKFVAYEFLKGHFGNYTNSIRGGAGYHRTVRERVEDSLGYLTMGAISKIIASTCTYPLQVIKSRLQQRSEALQVTDSGKINVVKREYSGVIDCSKRIWAREGFGGFFKGCLPNAIRVAPSAAITFVVYESVLDLIS